MNIAILSRGRPSKKNPTNGIFEYEQAFAMRKLVENVIFISIDFSLRNFLINKHIGMKICKNSRLLEYNISIPISFLGDRIKDFVFMLYFGKIIRDLEKDEISIDILHAHFYAIARYARIINRRYKLRYLVTEHSSNIISTTINRTAYNIYRNSELVIAVSPSLQKVIKDLYKLDNTIYIPNMVSKDTFSINYNRDDRIFRLICIGDLNQNKNFIMAIKAYLMFHQLHKDVRLVIIGDGKERRKLYLNSKGNKSISFLGLCSKAIVSKELSKSHCLISTSFKETFGVVIVEALMSGIPVIASKSGGPDSIIDDSNGVLLETLEVDELVEKMEYIYSNYKIYDRQKIREDAIRKYSEENVSRLIYNQYEKILFS